MSASIDSIRGEVTISVAQAAEVLGVGKDAAYAAVHAGNLPSLRLGSRIRVPVPALLHALGVLQTDAEPAPSNAGPATILTLAQEKNDAHPAPDSAA